MYYYLIFQVISYNRGYGRYYEKFFLECMKFTSCQLLVPPETPMSEDVDFDKLSQFEMSGGDIKSAVFRACIAAAVISFYASITNSNLLMQPSLAAPKLLSERKITHVQA